MLPYKYGVPELRPHRLGVEQHQRGAHFVGCHTPSLLPVAPVSGLNQPRPMFSGSSILCLGARILAILAGTFSSRITQYHIFPSTLVRSSLPPILVAPRMIAATDVHTSREWAPHRTAISQLRNGSSASSKTRTTSERTPSPDLDMRPPIKS